MKRGGFEAFLVTSLVNVRYLGGFKCSYGRMLFAGGQGYLLLDSRYTAAARRAAAGVEVVEITASTIDDKVREILQSHKLRRLAFEKSAVTHAEFLDLRAKLRGITLLPSEGLVEDLRIIKHEKEVAAIHRACRLGDRAFKHILGVIRPGITERQVSAALDSFMMSLEVDGLAFESIVASGPRGAFPHAVPSSRKIQNGDLVTLDFGVCLDGYNSDMTRTVAAGKPGGRTVQLYRAVQRAQAEALAAARPGMRASDLDAVARAALDKDGFGKYFTHGLGHGVGLEVHEAPRIGAFSKAVLKKGMIITVEPGVYVEGLTGARIEDTAVVTADGAQALTHSPKKLITL